MPLIQERAALRQLVGEPKPITVAKIHTKLTGQAQDFITRSPLMMLATASANGEATVSPKGDYPGFVQVENEQTLLIPERQGNNLLFTLQNIIDNPQVGLLFMVPRSTETLRVQGTAELTTDAELCHKLSANGRPALLVVTVKVVESYFHCGKAFIRSALWQPETWSEPPRVSFAREMAANTPMDPQAIEELDCTIQNHYAETLRSER